MRRLMFHIIFLYCVLGAMVVLFHQYSKRMDMMTDKCNTINAAQSADIVRLRNHVNNLENMATSTLLSNTKSEQGGVHIREELHETIQRLNRLEKWQYSMVKYMTGMEEDKCE